MNKRNPNHNLPDERTVSPFPNRWQRGWARLTAFNLRDCWWHLLDQWETRRAFRRTFYGLLALIAVLLGLGLWVYPWWTKRNAIRLAHQWLEAGRYQYAAEAVQEAMLVAPDSPEPWQIAAELARISGQKEKAVAYARQAANRAPAEPALAVAWAAEALRAELPAEAERALGKLTEAQQAGSAPAQRLRGELARRQGRLTAAKNHFESALRLDGPAAIDEVPLGLILLNATDAAERQRGVGLLVKWTTDREWGATALRTLLADARVRNEKVAMEKWAEALRVHPGCTLSDMPNCLLALSLADDAHFAEVLAAMEKDHAVNPNAALQLLSWLNQIGRSAEAVRWMQTLPATAMQSPPLVVAGAEALRQVANWPALQAWTQGKDWGPEVEFLRWSYALQAARMLGDEGAADELWRTLYSHAQMNSGHALFAASTFYSWGRIGEAEALWWRAADQEGKNAIDALGSLARHYQVKRDAEGQYRVFRKLRLLQPQNAAIGNNFAFFAMLTGHEQHQAELVAQANLAAEPNNRVYLATRAFTLFMQNRVAESLALLKPTTAEVSQSPALTFAYGLALAGTGQKPAAHVLLDPLPPESLTLREVELIKTALEN